MPQARINPWKKTRAFYVLWIIQPLLIMVGQFSFNCPEKCIILGLGGPWLRGGRRWWESKGYPGSAMEKGGGTRACSGGMVSSNERAGFFEKNCFGTGSAPVAPGTGDDAMTHE